MSFSEEPRPKLQTNGRRPHTKSKTGCSDCRKRRVKCTEERPRCRSCVRREIVCEYPVRPVAAAHVATSQSPTTQHGSPSTQHTRSRIEQDEGAGCRGTASPSHSSSSLPSTTKEFDLSDLALMHHWTVNTSIGFYKDPALSHLWQTVFPQIGFRHAFVARALLSLSALHLAHLDSHEDSPYVVAAIRLHDEALEGFQAAVSHIAEENSEALLVWSILNAIYVFGVSKYNTNNANKLQDSYRDRVLGKELVPMLRGISAVVAPTQEFLAQSRMQGLLSVGNWFSLNPDQQMPVPGSVDHKLCRAREAWEGSSDKDVYEDSLQVLRRCIMFMDQFATMDHVELQDWGCNRAWAGPLMFIMFVPERYFTLLHQRQPAALVLYAHFGGLLHRINEYWFLRGWGHDIVEVVNDLLGSYWRPLIRWPLEVTAVC